MAHHQAGARLPRTAKGDERELLVREFLEKVFPAPYRFGSGAVTDANGAVSGQLDIVVEWPFFASFPTPGGSQRLYLADSVAFVIEVKSNLVSQWQEAEQSTEKLRRLRRRWRGHSSVGTQAEIASVGPSISRIPFVAVGFAGHKTLDGLGKCIEDTPEDKRPDAALVIESGAYIGWLGRAIGPKGLFAFCVDGSYFVRNVLTAEPEWTEYLKEPEAG